MLLQSQIVRYNVSRFNTNCTVAPLKQSDLTDSLRFNIYVLCNSSHDIYSKNKTLYKTSFSFYRLSKKEYISMGLIETVNPF